MRMKKILCLLSFSVLLIACKQNIIYDSAITLPISGWHTDSACSFEVNVTDTVSTYDLFVYVRHTDKYPFQNMWLTVNSDTIEFYLANQYGKWLGNNKGRLTEMPVIYQTDYSFPHSGVYTFDIRQIMRDDVLRGVNDVILKVQKHE